MKRISSLLLWSILAAVTLTSSRSPAAFDEKSLRYLSPWDIIFKLQSTFPKANNPDLLYGCMDLQRFASAFGANAPATGLPLSSKPSPQTVRSIILCARTMASTQYLDTDKRIWKLLTVDQQKAVLRQVLRQILGEDEVILSYGLMKNIDQFISLAQTNYSQQNTETWCVENDWAVALVLRDEFLTY
jgi:hypothetical protein